MIMPRLTVKSDVVPVLYRVDEAAAALRLSRSSVYEAVIGQLSSRAATSAGNPTVAISDACHVPSRGCRRHRVRASPQDRWAGIGDVITDLSQARCTYVLNLDA